MSDFLAKAASPDVVMKAIRDSTTPTNKDYFAGQGPADDRDVAAYRKRLAEAVRFHDVYGGRPSTVRAKGDSWADIGEEFNTAVSNSETILQPVKDKYWDGCRQCATAPAEQVVEIVRTVGDYRVRYDVNHKWTSGWVRDLDSRLEAAIRNPTASGAPPHDGSAQGFGAMLGMVAGAIVGYVVPQVELARRIGAVLLGAGGAWAGWNIGEYAEPRARWIARAQSDVATLKALKEREGHLLEERVHQETLEKIADVVTKYHHEAQILNNSPIDRERRQRLKERMEKEVGRLMSPRKQQDPAEKRLEDEFIRAALANDAVGTGQAVIALAAAGNVMRRSSQAGSAGRLATIVDGFAKGAIGNPLNDPPLLWQ